MKKMFAFFKENSYDIVKMIVNQIGMIIFGATVTMATLKLSGNMGLEKGMRWPLSLASVFSIAFYMFLLFYMTMEIGGKDGVRIEAGRMEYSRFKGLYMSLWANSLNILLAILAIIGKLFTENVGFFEYGKDIVGSPAWAAGLNSVSELILKLLNMMYIGLQVEYFSGNPLFYIVIILPALATCTLAYNTGVRRILKGDPKTLEKKKKYELEKEKNDIYYQQ